MKLFEYQAKEVFQEAGIPVPESCLLHNSSDLPDAVCKIGFPLVLKSQVLSGGRGKAGLIQFADSETAAQFAANRLFSLPLSVPVILVEEAIDIVQELYLSITYDPLQAKVMIIACQEGGVDIEQLAVHSPEKLLYEEIDISQDILSFQCNNVAYGLTDDAAIARQISGVIARLYRIFRTFDAELAEINPLFVSRQGQVIAGDGKLIIDDNSLFRQKTFEMTREYFDSDIEYQAHKIGIPYIQFAGDISMMCAGAGLATTVYDLINDAGGSIANYLEFGGPNYQKAEQAMELCLQNQSKVILIVTFGTIARADVMADGVVRAMTRLKPDRPIVTCIRGTNEEQAHQILRQAGVHCILDTEEAVNLAVEIASRRVEA